MQWRKLGLVFCPSGEHEWMQSHATNPVAEHLKDDRFRVYFSSRDSKNRSQIASIDINLSNDSAAVVETSLCHVLSHGKHGHFDDSGVTVTGLVQIGQKRLLYYLGWNLGVTIPFRNAIGVAVSEGDCAEFIRVSEAPVVDRNHVDPISLSYPFLLWEDECFRIWYGTCIKWSGSSVSDYQFSLKYAKSYDGLVWEREGQVVLGCDFPQEDAIARPHIISENGLYKMWYSRKKGPCYRMGYAESTDGHNWIRLDDDVGLDVSPSGWDSDMVEYPFVFDHKGQRYMLYNGNSYGKTGFGLAVLTDD
jgi:hypothetical protein